MNIISKRSLTLVNGITKIARKCNALQSQTTKFSFRNIHRNPASTQNDKSTCQLQRKRGLFSKCLSHYSGPATWEKDFPIAKGKRQSPIDIQTKKAVYDGDLGNEPLKIDYQPESELCLKNNGHSIMCQIKQKSELSGGPLKGKYRLEQFHLHWGSQDNKGSEHTIDGKMYAAELHLVHYNASKYKTFAEAVDKPDGLAVLGVMIKVGTEHQAFKQITDHVSEVAKSGSDIKVSSTFDPTFLLPGNTSQYWTYLGSLTTPPLFESVQWIVFKEPVEYSKDQMAKLRSLIDSEGHKMQDNYRPPLPLQGRELRSSFP